MGGGDTRPPTTSEGGKTVSRCKSSCYLYAYACMSERSKM